MATLRDYLTCEYRAKMPDKPAKQFNKLNMPGHCVKVPQQNNYTDCGLYLLQYVEHFFLVSLSGSAIATIAASHLMIFCCLHSLLPAGSNSGLPSSDKAAAGLVRNHHGDEKARRHFQPHQRVDR